MTTSLSCCVHSVDEGDGVDANRTTDVDNGGDLLDELLENDDIV